MAANPKEPSTPPPAIGKIGPYTVFLTPSATATTTATNVKPSPVLSPSIPETPKKVTQFSPPPVQPPPAKFEPASDRFAFLWDAVSKVQTVHASVDEYMANWLGLNQSKYQWALDDYYESKGLEKGDVQSKDAPSKRQTV